MTRPWIIPMGYRAVINHHAMLRNHFLYPALMLPGTFSRMNAQTVNAADFGLKEGEDATLAIRLALEACQAQDARRLVIPAGTYLFYPEKAAEKYVHISNNDDGLKRIAFPIHGYRDFEIDAGGAKFIMHGEMVAFDIQNAENIVLKNFSIDWNKPFYFQGQVINVHEDLNAFDLKVYEECDYEIVANELIFLEKPGTAVRTWRDWAMSMKQDMGWEQNIDWNIWFNPQTKAGAFGAGPHALRSWNEQWQVRYHVEEIKKGVLRFYDAAPVLPKKDWVLIVKGKKSPNRTSPAIHVYNSRNIAIENVTVHHAGGMSFIAERTENVSLEGFDVRLPEGSGRMVTTTADATNVHGIYTRVAENLTWQADLHMRNTTVRRNRARSILISTGGPDKFGLGFEVISPPGAARIPIKKGAYGWGGAFGSLYWVDPEEALVAQLVIQKTNNYADVRAKFIAAVYQAIDD